MNRRVLEELRLKVRLLEAKANNSMKEKDRIAFFNMKKKLPCPYERV